VVVGVPGPRVGRICAGPRLAARVTNDAGIDNDENGAPIWVCDRLVAPLSPLWPALKRYE
jgi:hypothetical protein